MTADHWLQAAELPTAELTTQSLPAVQSSQLPAAAFWAQAASPAELALALQRSNLHAHDAGIISVQHPLYSI